MAEKGLSLEEILRGTSPDKLDQPCQDDHLCEVANHITDWPSLAPLLGIWKVEMEEVRGKWPFSVPGQKIEFLRKWREKHGCKATYQSLCLSLWKAGDVALIEKLCDTISKPCEGSDDEDAYFSPTEGSEDEDSYTTAPEGSEDEGTNLTPSPSSEAEPSPVSLHHTDPFSHVEPGEGVGRNPSPPPPQAGQVAQEGRSPPRDAPASTMLTSEVNTLLQFGKGALFSLRATNRPSLVEVLRRIPPEKLDQPCQDEHLCEVARHVTDWPSLAPLLGLSRPEMEEVRGRWPISMGGQRTELLRKWQDKLGQMGTYRKLCEAFYAAEQTALVDRVCEILCTFQLATSREIAHPLDPYARYLHDMYDVIQPQFLVLQWPPPPTRRVFNLAMIHTDDVQRASTNEELVRLLQRGNVAEYTKKRVSVQLQDLFRLDKMKRKFILIEGAPGSGKSTLAWHICQQWKAYELFREFRMVVFVQLRDPRVQSAQSIADLLPAGSEERKTNAAAGIKECEGRGVLFVMDGWDEYGPGFETGSIVCKLICTSDELDVPYSTLLITSRPIASAPLQQLASSRVEIVGFTPEEVSQYFQEVVKDPATVRALQEQLKDLPVIEACCYLPLNAAIVAHLFLGLNHTLPRTLHEVFSALVCGCIIRHVTKQTGKIGCIPRIPSLDKLPHEVQAPFENVCKLAYEASMKSKATFSGEDLTSYGVSLEGNGLGLLQGVQSFLSGKSDAYHFLHLSVQELLAAVHISKLGAVDQVDVFHELIEEPRLVSVFRFYAALTKLETEGIKEIVASVIGGSKLYSPEATQRRQYVLNILHCLYEAQDTTLCLFVAPLLDGGLDLCRISLGPLDCLCVGYFLCCVCTSGQREFGVNLSECRLDSNRIGFVAKELSKCAVGSDLGSSNNTMVGCLRLSLRSNSIEPCGVRSICDFMVSNPSVIGRLDLSKTKIQEGEDGFLRLLHMLCSNCLLVEVKLYGCNLQINAENGPVLVEMLHKNVSLKVLELSGNNGIGDTGVGYIVEGMKDNSGVVKLELAGCGIGEKGGKLLGEMLTENGTLEHLNIRFSKELGDIGIMAVSDGLKVNCRLEELWMWSCGYSLDGLKEFVLSLKENSHLRRLRVDWEKMESLVEERAAVNELRRQCGEVDLEIDS